MLTSFHLAAGLLVTQASEKAALPPSAHSSPPFDDRQTISPAMLASESELSDVPEQQPPADTLLSDSSTSAPKENGFHADDSGLSDDEDVGMGSEDADFEIEFQPLEPGAPRDPPSSSEESIRPPKRKLYSIEDDMDIMNNPELYGIRRSVRPFPYNTPCLC